jgi:hypothetical protein
MDAPPSITFNVSHAPTQVPTEIAVASPAPSTAEATLPEAPEPQPSISSDAGASDAGSSGPDQAAGTDAAGQAAEQPVGGRIVPRKYALMIEPWQRPARLTVGQKFVWSMIAASRPVTLAPALYSASYEQLVDSDPKYGSDSGAYAARFGAAMAHSVSTRLIADGLFASAFHQDPRYYRIANGSIVHRGLRSALQALERRGDNGNEEINYSGLLGRGASAALVLAYYPPVSQTTKVVLTTWGLSIASDAGGDLVLEFLPDLRRKFPILNRFKVE